MLLSARQASLLLVDIQQRLLPAMATPERVVANAKILLTAAQQLGLPVTVSEQYSKGLGPTVPELDAGAGHVFEKLSFSCWRDKTLKSHFIHLHEHGQPMVIIAGIEAHVCVLQSALDLAGAGFGVFAVADAMSSRKAKSAQLALARMRANGIQVVNTEMVVFELLEVADTPAFKAVSALIK